VSRPDDLAGLLEAQPDARFVLELETSMRRHGMTAQQLWSTSGVLRHHRGARLEGVALHLPLASGNHVAEVERLLTDVVAAELPVTTLWVSHLTATELTTLRSSYPDLSIRPRIGTDLWLGDRAALRVTATVLDVHVLQRGDAFGYRVRRAPRDGHLLVVSGGTAHGIGLESPKGDAGLKARAAVLARGGMDAMGLTRSPYWVDGKQRLFAEPPHMQASMLFLPRDAAVPAVGDLVDVRVRYTATTFDRVDVS
jgi:alanine racemase